MDTDLLGPAAFGTNTQRWAAFLGMNALSDEWQAWAQLKRNQHSKATVLSSSELQMLFCTKFNAQINFVSCFWWFLGKALMLAPAHTCAAYQLESPESHDLLEDFDGWPQLLAPNTVNTSL